MFELAELDELARPHMWRHDLHERLRHIPRPDGLSDFEFSLGTLGFTGHCPACGAEVEIELNGRDLHRLGWGVPYSLPCCGSGWVHGRGDARVWR